MSVTALNPPYHTRPAGSSAPLSAALDFPLDCVGLSVTLATGLPSARLQSRQPSSRIIASMLANDLRSAIDICWRASNTAGLTRAWTSTDGGCVRFLFLSMVTLVANSPIVVYSPNMHSSHA
jgi:hypothetical protein